jgi:hypothetical protein
MPKKGVSPEEKQKAFDQWKEGDEFKAIMNFTETRLKDDEVNGVELAMEDITSDWQPICDDLFAMIAAMKVPGRKAKSFE